MLFSEDYSGYIDMYPEGYGKQRGQFLYGGNPDRFAVLQLFSSFKISLSFSHIHGSYIVVFLEGTAE
jgi:hypothetical protein